VAEALKQIDNDWVVAQKGRDAAKLSAILGDDWVGLGWSGKSEGKDSSRKYTWTDVFVQRNGVWKAVASQSTKVPE
jgi:hypothetical protein